MISCTKYIPAYSELFTYLDNKYGREEVDRLWDYLFTPTGKGGGPLLNLAKKDGVKGCVDYWTDTFTGEAADATFVYNLEDGWFLNKMHHCPSKGRLLELKKAFGFEPYKHYCDHCDYYRKSLEQCGLTWVCDHLAADEAGCSRVLWDIKKFKGIMNMNENTVVKEFHASELEYYHPAFHRSLNRCIEYVGMTHGEDDIKAYLTMYTKDVYKPVFAAMKQDALGAIENEIRETYMLERAEDALTIVNDGNKLSVMVAYCPAVKYLRDTGKEVSKWFSLSTETVMQTLAEHAGLTFAMESYDEETGAAAYSFTR